MALYSISNNCRSGLAVAALATDTTLTLTKAAAPYRDPIAPSAGKAGVMTLTDAIAGATKIEIVTYAGVTVNADTTITLTGVVRACEGTTAQAWPVNTVTFSALTADLVNGLGSAALADTAAFATAAQGAKADNAVPTSSKGIANGVSPLESDAKISTTYLPTAVLGQVSYQGTWDASTGSVPTAAPSKGWYYIVTVSGTTNLSGITDWVVGDWAIYDGTQWDKVDNTDSVSSVAGLVGVISVASLQTALTLGSAAYQPSTAFATAAQGTKADAAVPNTTTVNGKALSANISLTPADVGAATAAQGAKADTALQDGSQFATAAQGAKADAAQPALGYTPVQQGTGAGQYTNIIRIGYGGSAAGVLLSVDSTAMGMVHTDSFVKRVYTQSTDPGAVPDGSLWVW